MKNMHRQVDQVQNLHNNQKIGDLLWPAQRDPIWDQHRSQGSAPTRPSNGEEEEPLLQWSGMKQKKIYYQNICWLTWFFANKGCFVWK